MSSIDNNSWLQQFGRPNYNLLYLGSTIFGNVNNVVVKSKFFSLATNLLLPINLCTVDLSIIWVGQYLYGNAVF